MPLFRHRPDSAPHAPSAMAARSFGPRSRDFLRGANSRLTTGKDSGIGLRKDRNPASFSAWHVLAARASPDLIPAQGRSRQALCPKTIRRPARLAGIHIAPAAGRARAMPRNAFRYCDQSAPLVGTNSEGCWQLSFIAGASRFRAGRSECVFALTGRYSE